MLSSLLPGTEKFISVCYSPDHQSVIASLLNPQEEKCIEQLNINDAKSVLARLRSEKADYTWLQRSDLPFEISVKDKVQLEIFNEFNNNILLIRIENKFDHLNDLYFVYFSPVMSSVGTSGSSKGISAENKQVIAHLVRNSILFETDRSKADKSLFNVLLDHHENTLTENSLLKSEVTILKEKFNSGMSDLVNYYLKEISTEAGRKFLIDKGAEEKLTAFGNLGALHPVLKRAAMIAELSSADPSGLIYIKQHHINLEERKPVSENETSDEMLPAGSSRYAKTLVLLNKLETAARKIKLRNEVLTSAGIGNELPIKITAPAISDALKKHRTKILHLLKEYPDKWSIIRNEFRPVRNIVNSKPDREQLSA